MATRRLGPPGGDDPPDHPTRRLPRLQRQCLACHADMAPVRYWTSADDHGWGELRFGPRHPDEVPMPMMPMPSTPPYWERGRGLVLPTQSPTGPMDVAPEVEVQTFACTRCERLDWYLVGPMRGDEGGMR